MNLSFRCSFAAAVFTSSLLVAAVWNRNDQPQNKTTQTPEPLTIHAPAATGQLKTKAPSGMDYSIGLSGLKDMFNTNGALEQ